MAKSRPEKTLADYVAIAISPVLIMALAGSLAFFLLEATYGGEHPDRLRWILFCFVCASVLVGRIAIEEGSKQAATFGLALALVTGLAAFQLAPDGAFVGLGVLAVIWWSVHRLTYDCTLIDDDVDASGEGLLQASGLEPTDSGDGKPARKRPWWKHFLGEPDGSRAPGTWVVYFSLAALPLFGIGQVLIPAYETRRREFAFYMLLIYVASALGLLLTTSFLGLRRYLRQRRLKMPVTMAATWLGTGLMLIGAILGLCFLMPRPDHSATASDLWRQVTDATRSASDFAQGKSDPGEGEGRKIAPPKKPEANKDDPHKAADSPAEKKQSEEPNNDANQPGEPPAEPKDPQAADRPKADAKQGGEKQEGQKQGGQQQDGEQQGGQKQDEEKKDGKQDGQKPAENRPGEKPPRDPEAQRQPGQKPKDDAQNQDARNPQPPPPPPRTQNPPQSNSTWLAWLANNWRWLVWGVFALVGLFFLIRNWTDVCALLRRIWTEFLGLFRFGRPADGDETENASEVVAPRMRPFADCRNPFDGGAGDRLRPGDVLRQTFDALQAWCLEYGPPRRPEQTPLEFGQQVQSAHPTLGDDARELAQLYARFAYAGQMPDRDSLELMRRLWRKMEAGV